MLDRSVTEQSERGIEAYLIILLEEGMRQFNVQNNPNRTAVISCGGMDRTNEKSKSMTRLPMPDARARPEVHVEKHEF